MPGLLNVSAPANSPQAPASKNAIWSKKRDEITFERLQKFWSELPIQVRKELLRVDKQALFEQARKNLYCSRCNGLLLEGFTQIVTYAKSLQQENSVYHLTDNKAVHFDSDSEDIQDPLVHPWGGLAATRDGILTLLNCFIDAQSLETLQNVFDSARAREHEREMLYPDACGGDGRGWTSHGLTNYGRGYGPRETCALHTARLSCDALLDFWSALGEETRMSLLRMKEEDFIERLMYRFDSKRFCRDCRRNVIREFKELKELKRMRRELRCTSWFCVADTAFQYEVTEDAVHVDWQQYFAETVRKYHHFEWAIGSGEGKSDILEFEDVGMSGKVQVNGLDLGDLNACFITLRAWKLDGKCTEICVKAHALKGQPCVHRRLMIGDGFVMITKGESIRRFFEHAEEAEEEEEDDAMDRDGNEIDGEGSRPQKHAKSPELAREFLLDAATVIFKEQVEKAFREGTARQNAHSMFVSLALKLLEERIHVACKEIITFEKQNKLLEEEEKEKREEEERKERRRAKEREKKHRKKERRKDKEREKEKKPNESNSSLADSQTSVNALSPITEYINDSVSNPEEIIICTDIKDEELTNSSLNNGCHADEEEFDIIDSNSSFIIEQSKSRRKVRVKKDPFLCQPSKWYDIPYLNVSDTSFNGGHNRPLKQRVVKTIPRIAKKFEKHQCSSNRLPRPLYRNNKYSPMRQVWEPRNNSNPDVNMRASIVSNQSDSVDFDKVEISGEMSKVDALSNDSDEVCGDGRKKSIDHSDPLRNSSSSDSCSSCLSEGDNSSSSCSGNQNTESSSNTSDSEDVTTPQSDEKTNGSESFMRCSDEEQRKDVGVPETRVFGVDILPVHNQHIQLPMHKSNLQVPVFSSPAVGYHNQSPLPWQVPPFPHYNHFAYPSNILGYNKFGMSYNPLHTITPLFSVPQHTIYPFNNGVYVANPKEEIKDVIVTEKPIKKQFQDAQTPNTKTKLSGENESKSSFSLFHFGGPLAGTKGFNFDCQADAINEDTTIEEYSLFNGSRFLVF